MPQRALPFQYAQENTSTGMTSLSGLPAYVDMLRCLVLLSRCGLI